MNGIKAMGKSNSILIPFYQNFIKPVGDVALLGFTDNEIFSGDCYDLQLDNWNINSEWVLPKKYDTIICTRCAYFSKNPEDLIKRCHDSLNKGGVLYIDWGLGDHWRFSDYKIGWVKNNEHEFAYEKNNFLWSTIWSDDLLKDEEFKKFSSWVKPFGYLDLKKSIFDEVPNILDLQLISNYYTTSYKTLALWPEAPQIYILLRCEKK